MPTSCCLYKNCAAASFDLVAATDVFVYMGDLAAIFMETRRVLRSGGLFAFSVESVSDGGSDYVLDITGRYRQSETYLRRLAGNCGLRIAHIAPVVIRHEAEQQVCGYLCVFVAP